jgi:hypothetical protein
MTEQLPCLKLNARSITPKNDVEMCPDASKKGHVDSRGLNGHQAGQALGRVRCEQIGSTCGNRAAACPERVSPQAQVTGGQRRLGSPILSKSLICKRRAKRWRIRDYVFTLRAVLTDLATSRASPRWVQHGLNTRRHSPPTRPATSLYTCHACPPRYRAWCGSPGPAR